MAKKRVTRKQLLKEPDEFLTLTTRAIQWCRQHPKPLAIGGGIVAALIIIVIGANTYSDYRSRAAFALLGQGMKQLTALDQKTEADLATLQPDFEKLLSKYGHQAAGRVGRIIYAHIQLTKGSADDAIKLYSAALADFQKDPALVNIINNGLASAYEKKGMASEAVATYEKLVESKETVLKDRALFHLGQLYDQEGHSDKSDQSYARLVADFPDSMYTPIAREAHKS